jgi:nitrogen fixation protein
VLNLYSSRGEGSYRPDYHRLRAYKDQELFAWPAAKNIFPNEKLAENQKSGAGHFILREGSWRLVNDNLPGLVNLDTNTGIPTGGKIVLTDGLKMLLSPEDGGRLVVVQMTEGKPD